MMTSKNAAPAEQPLFQPMGETHHDSAAAQFPQVKVHDNGIGNAGSFSPSQQQGDKDFISKTYTSYSATNSTSKAESSQGLSNALDGHVRATQGSQPIKSWDATATRAYHAQPATAYHHKSARMPIERNSTHIQSYTSPRVTSSAIPSMNIAQHGAQQGTDFPPYDSNPTEAGHVIRVYDAVLKDMQSMLIEMRQTLEDNKIEMQKLRQRLQEQDEEQKRADPKSIKYQGESSNDFVFRAPTIEIDKYSGLPSENFEFWLEDFLQSCNCMQLTSLQRLNYLPKVLTG